MSVIAARLPIVCVLARRRDDGAPDEYGQPTRAEDRQPSRCRLDPVDGSETVEGAELDLRRTLLATDAGDLKSNDALIVDAAWTAETFEDLGAVAVTELVDAALAAGTAQVWEFTATPVVMHDALGTAHHVEATVRRGS